MVRRGLWRLLVVVVLELEIEEGACGCDDDRRSVGDEGGVRRGCWLGRRPCCWWRKVWRGGWMALQADSARWGERGGKLGMGGSREAVDLMRWGKW